MAPPRSLTATQRRHARRSPHRRRTGTCRPKVEIVVRPVRAPIASAAAGGGRRAAGPCRPPQAVPRMAPAARRGRERDAPADAANLSSVAAPPPPPPTASTTHAQAASAAVRSLPAALSRPRGPEVRAGAGARPAISRVRDPRRVRRGAAQCPEPERRGGACAHMQRRACTGRAGPWRCGLPGRRSSVVQ